MALLSSHDVQDRHKVSNINLLVTIDVSSSVVFACSHDVQHSYGISDVNLLVAVEVTCDASTLDVLSDGDCQLGTCLHEDNLASTALYTFGQRLSGNNHVVVDAVDEVAFLVLAVVLVGNLNRYPLGNLIGFLTVLSNGLYKEAICG